MTLSCSFMRGNASALVPSTKAGCKQYNTYLHKDQVANLRLLASIQSRKETEVVREAIDAYLMQHEDELRAALSRFADLRPKSV